jgi:hypothetical protein
MLDDRFVKGLARDVGVECSAKITRPDSLIKNV